jgi:hypothetical protein
MDHTTPPKPAAAPPTHAHDLRAAVLSYLVPGLGQIVQGRVAKGILFLVCLYALFFYGMYLGNWSNVYIPDSVTQNRNNNPLQLPQAAADVYNRLQFAGQFWIGVAAWPAIWQYYHYDHTREEGPLFGTFQRQLPESSIDGPRKAGGEYEGPTLNKLQIERGKRWDLGWVYTVIAGVLNILVIYDAFAGPTFLTEPRPRVRPEGVPAA